MKRKKVSVGPRIRGSYHLSMAGVECDEVRSRILQLRLMILVHSCLYYTYNQNLVSDYQWAEWGQELVKLQKQYPDIARRVDYHKDFQDFDPSTGFDLPYRNPEIMSKALWLLERSKKRGPVESSHGAKSGGTVVRVKIP